MGRNPAGSEPLHLSEDRGAAGSGGLQHRWRARAPLPFPDSGFSDTLAPFAQAILVIRWGTTVVSLLLASPDLRDGDERLIVASAALLTYTLYRTVRPLRSRDELRSLLILLGEVAFTLLLLVSTGYWESPLAFSMLTAVAVAGFARGFGFGLRIATVAILAVSIPWALEPQFDSEDLRTSVQWAVEVLLVALVAGFARRISGEADQRQILAMDRLGRLSDANALLYQLHQVTQTLPCLLYTSDAADEL